MRCAVYARYSSDLQRETSIEDQIALARRYAEQQGWTVLDEHIYTDPAVSGASLEGRPGITALLAAAAISPRPFDFALVEDSSRTGRDLPDELHIMRMLKFLGIRIIYISQQIDSDNEQAETLVTIHGFGRRALSAGTGEEDPPRTSWTVEARISHREPDVWLPHETGA
jgi:DNA invertase Pin-like site-specific DNA recombinase